MPDAGAFHVRRADWTQEAVRLSALRARVFITEQGVPAEQEWDGRDPHCMHMVAEAPDGTVIGTGRLLPAGRIGRLVVAAHWRGRGVGSTLIAALVACARERGCDHVELHAQADALAFYERHGFRATGIPFMEAGILHQRLERPLVKLDDD
jgi:predicted GNAT family N-acyltransferase